MNYAETFNLHFCSIEFLMQLLLTLWRRNFLLNFSTPVFKM
jgi:hypothetical protein